MTSNGYYGNWPENYTYRSFQERPASERWNQSGLGGINISSASISGYVHSGYQAALQGSSLQSNESLQSNLWPQPSHPMQSSMDYTSMRPPRLGPGGPFRCSYPGCEYSGYEKGVEIHKMDRHLIFPPGYKPPKSVPDADVGPNVTIPGTGISLKTPYAIEAWIAERKKNWPTAARIAEKQKRKAEAVERGELGHGPNKRARIEGSRSVGEDFPGSYRGKGRGRGEFRGRRRGVGAAGSAPRIVQHATRPAVQTPAKPSATGLPAEDGGADSDTNSGSDVDPIRDVVSSKVQPPDYEVEEENSKPKMPPKDSSIKAHKKRPPKQPAPKLHNPLVDRPSFLRKLLQPEITHTVSNLSQAIRFIVDNDMFKGVELKPGDAENVLIKEV